MTLKVLWEWICLCAYGCNKSKVQFRLSALYLSYVVFTYLLLPHLLEELKTRLLEFLLKYCNYLPWSTNKWLDDVQLITCYAWFNISYYSWYQYFLPTSTMPCKVAFQFFFPAWDIREVLLYEIVGHLPICLLEICWLYEVLS